jgi:CheY-like chemotaxis protein
MKRVPHIASVIVVTSSAELGRLYKRQFERSGLKLIAVFSNGSSLLSYFEKRGKSSHNVVVMLDRDALGAQFVEIAKTIKERDPSIKVFLVAAKKLPPQSEAGGLYYDGIVLKPFTMSELLQTIRNSISKVKERGTAVLEKRQDMDVVMFDILNDSGKKLCASETSWKRRDIEDQNYWSSLVAATQKGMQVQLITSITIENLAVCKDLITTHGVEIRHLPGLAREFMIFDERHFVSISRLSEDSSRVEELIYSNLSSVIQENQFLFDKWWRLAIPAARRIQELETRGQKEEEEYGRKIASFVLGLDKISRDRIDIIERSRATLDIAGPAFLAKDLEDDHSLREACIGAKSRGARCRFMTNISSHNLAACQAVVRMGFIVKHTPSPIGELIISEKESLSSTKMEKPERGTASSKKISAIYSDHRGFVDEKRMFFEALWEVASPISSRVYEIERDRERTIF